jgi:mRNA interferase YafQ
MRQIERSSAFKRDYKRIVGQAKVRDELAVLLPMVLMQLLNDQALAPHLRDHVLTGNWAGHRECHLKPDLLLIYKKMGDDLLQLVRLGSHSELF